MTPASLTPEWLHMPSLGAGDLRSFEAIGITRRAIALAGGLAKCNVRHVGRTWTPDPQGLASVILPVWADGAPSLFNAVEHPVLIDLIALAMSDEGIWHYRHGEAGLVLGAERFDLAHTEEIPLTLFLSPLRWLRAECAGAVVLDYAEAVWRADDAAAADALVKQNWRVA